MRNAWVIAKRDLGSFFEKFHIIYIGSRVVIILEKN